MNSNKRCSVLVISLIVAALSGCSAKVTESGGGGGGNSPVIKFPSDTTVLEGRWVLGCSQITAQAYGAGEVDFSGNTYSTSMTLYSDSACSSVIVPAQVGTGTFVIPAAGEIDQTSSTGQMAYNVFEIDSNVLYVGLQAGTDPSTRPQAVDKNVAYDYAGPAEVISAPVNQNPPIPVSGTFTPPTTCPNLSGNYQMNADVFTLTQTGCSQLSWYTPAQPWNGTPDSTTVYNANDLFTPLAVNTQNDPTLTGLERSYFQSGQFDIEDDLTDSSGTQVQLTIYTLTATPCDLANPTAGVTYLMAQGYVNGQIDANDCNFWARQN